jgi:general secretion pathway protein E
MAVLAQRLVRKLCPLCKQPYLASDEDLRSLGIDPATGQVAVRASLEAAASGPLLDEMTPALGWEGQAAVAAVPALRPRAAEPPTFYRAVGCEACAHTGYRGRIGIYELLVISDAVRKEILNNSDSNAITRAGLQGGMRSLRQDGSRQVLFGITSVEEVLAATQAGDLG